MAGKIKVPSELVPSQSNQVMLRSKYIYDDVKGHTQEEVNAALEEQIESKVIEAGGVNWDTIPTAGSDNAVKSKHIKAALEKITGYFVLDSDVTESTVAKTVTVTDFISLALGGSIKIKMLTKNTANNPTLRIGTSNASAYPLYYNNEKASADNSWEAGEVVSVYFDGTNYQASNAQGGGGTIKEGYDISDLDIGDEYGYTIARFYDGHILTKNFDSKKAPTCDNIELYDFEISDKNGYSIVRFYNGHIQTKNFDSSDFHDKYVDCLGDSLTMGSENFGWFETELQELLGSKYIVRNWGVGGENIATIMARLGAAQVVFPSSFVLPANGSTVQISTKNNPMTSAFNGAPITPLLQGASNDSGQKNRVVNPCYVNGIECTMIYTGNDVYANSPYTLQRNSVGNRDITLPVNTPIYFNTGKQMGKSNISIVWMGTNGGYDSIDELVAAQKIVAEYLSNNQYIFIGLHKLVGETATDYENKMTKQFGNKFFNIREYCCTNMIYDCGITPTSEDLANMENGICPTSLLYDSTHFNPTSNTIIGKKVYELCEQLGYLIN